MTQFNFFKVLEKDSKELIHSAFISYLLDNNKNFIKRFIHSDIHIFESSVLEKSYNHKKLRVRIDIEIRSSDGKFITLIENKFKSFPTEGQLINYNKVFKKQIDKSIKLKKILFCFDKSIVKFETDWHIFDYDDLLQFLKQDYKDEPNNDEHIFVKHYIAFLENYIDTYKNLKSHCNHLFNKHISNDDKFWVRLLNSQIALELEREFPDIDFIFQINPGSTAVPLLNIIPKHWKKKTNEELLIQFQGNYLKFYLHYNSKEIAEEIISFSSDKLWNENIELKKLDKRKEKSCYIFRTKLNDNLKDDFTYIELYGFIVDFYNKIDSEIIKNYSY